MTCITPCSSCVFLVHCNEDSACYGGNVIIDDPSHLIPFHTPGFCRDYRTIMWLRKKDLTNLGPALAVAREESALTADLVVLFDGRIEQSDQILRTYSGMVWQFPEKKMPNLIVISSNSQCQGRGLFARLTDWHHQKKLHGVYHVIHPTEPLDDETQLLSSAIARVKSPYFVVLHAGSVVENIRAAMQHINKIRSRVIFWPFPFRHGTTILEHYSSVVGIHLTHGFKLILRSTGASEQQPVNYRDQLVSLSKAIGYNLSWTLGECLISEPDDHDD